MDQPKPDVHSTNRLMAAFDTFPAISIQGLGPVRNDSLLSSQETRRSTTGETPARRVGRSRAGPLPRSILGAGEVACATVRSQADELRRAINDLIRIGAVEVGT